MKIQFSIFFGGILFSEFNLTQIELFIKLITNYTRIFLSHERNARRKRISIFETIGPVSQVYSIVVVVVS